MAILNRRKPATEEIKTVKLNRRPKPTEKKIENHWEVINLSEDRCFVCDKPFKKGQRIICVGHKDSIGLNRHIKCNCTSERWRRKFADCKTLTLFEKKKKQKKEKTS